MLFPNLTYNIETLLFQDCVNRIRISEINTSTGSRVEEITRGMKEIGQWSKSSLYGVIGPCIQDGSCLKSERAAGSKAHEEHRGCE